MTRGHVPFEISFRPPYADVDRMNFVYYAHFLKYFEMVRSAWLRHEGLPYGELETQGVLLPVLEAHCEYRQPAHYDELITVAIVRAARIRAHIRIEYDVRRDNDVLATGHTVHACTSPDGRVLRPPRDLKRLCTETP
mgnify:FL=1